MLVITAPSKTQNPVENTARATVPQFIEDASTLNVLLKTLSREELCRLMKMSDKLGESTYQRIRNFRVPLNSNECRQAIFTFEGDSYSALKPLNYSTEQLEHIQDRLLILSGLYGMLRPLDLMHPYRLEMGTPLQTKRGKNLYEFWGDRITEAINTMCMENNSTTLVNLASLEYSKCIRKKLLQPRFLTVTFKEAKGEGFKTIPIHSKRARGMMIDYVIRNMLTGVEELRSFSEGGYRFNEPLSNEKEWVFTRNPSK